MKKVVISLKFYFQNARDAKVPFTKKSCVRAATVQFSTFGKKFKWNWRRPKAKLQGLAILFRKRKKGLFKICFKIGFGSLIFFYSMIKTPKVFYFNCDQ